MIQHIQNGLPGSQVRAFHSNGGWIIEIIHPQMNAQRTRILAQVEHLLNNLPAGVQRDIVWKLFSYSNTDESFREQGTLHTIPEEDDHGISLVTLSADDTYVDLTEFDCEILSFSSYHGRTMIARVSRNSNGQILLPYQNAVPYSWLEALGGNYGIQGVASVPARAGYLNITLRR